MTWFFGFGPQTSLSLMLSSSSHRHTHSSRCVSVVDPLMYSTASVYRSSWLIISCFLFLTRATSCLELHKFWPNEAQLRHRGFFTIHTKTASSYFYLDKNPRCFKHNAVWENARFVQSGWKQSSWFFPARLPRNGKGRLSALWWNFSLLTTDHGRRKRPTSELMSNSCAPCSVLFLVRALNAAAWAGHEPKRVNWGSEGDHRGKKNTQSYQFERMTQVHLMAVRCLWFPPPCSLFSCLCLCHVCQ